jgi:hypothetical protein
MTKRVMFVGVGLVILAMVLFMVVTGTEKTQKEVDNTQEVVNLEEENNTMSERNRMITLDNLRNYRKIIEETKHRYNSTPPEMITEELEKEYQRSRSKDSGVYAFSVMLEKHVMTLPRNTETEKRTNSKLMDAYKVSQDLPVNISWDNLYCSNASCRVNIKYSDMEKYDDLTRDKVYMDVLLEGLAEDHVIFSLTESIDRDAEILDAKVIMYSSFDDMPEEFVKYQKGELSIDRYGQEDPVPEKPEYIEPNFPEDEEEDFFLEDIQ